MGGNGKREWVETITEKCSEIDVKFARNKKGEGKYGREFGTLKKRLRKWRETAYQEKRNERHWRHVIRQMKTI